MEDNLGFNAEDIYKKYSSRIEMELEKDVQDVSKNYVDFKQEMMPSISKYEKWVKAIGGLFNIKLADKDEAKIKRQLDIAHLDLFAGQTVTFAIFLTLIVFVLGVGLVLAVYMINDSFPAVFLAMVLFACLFIFYYFYNMPFRLANKWRLKASSQMVPCILYVVVYMRHTSNLERAISFAAKHLEAPLALDFKKIFWDVETGKYSTIKESLDAYLEGWRDYSIEFIEAFHLIESSLFEPSETRRILILEKSLQVILDGVYEKMLKYSHEIRSPLTNIYMLGIVLPTLALAIVPLATVLLGGAISWYHIFVVFNIIVPFFVFYLTNEVMLKRPGGYGETALLEKNPDYEKFKSKKPYLIAFLITFPILILGLLPFIFQFTALPSYFGLNADYTFGELGIKLLSETRLFDFQNIDGEIVGPFGPLSLLLSLLVPLSIGLFFMIAYGKKTKELIKSRDDSKDLEGEFTSSLFQLGNRIGDGMPAEVAFGRIAESTRGMKTENFFRIVNSNIQQQGMSLEEALFNSSRGAIIYYPSQLISTSMRILVESVKKGLDIAARSLMSISEYVKNINKINERLRDLLAEVVSDMKSNMVFLAPLLAGVVIGLSGMITFILVKLQVLNQLQEDLTVAGGMQISGVLALFDVVNMVSPYYLQVSIGIYLIEIIFILTKTLVTVDAGEDTLKEIHDIGKYVGRGIMFYVIVALISISVLGVLAGVTLGGVLA